MSKEAIKLAASVLKGSQEYKRGHTIFVEAVEELEEALVDQPAPVQQCMDHGECFGGKCIYPAPQPAQHPKTKQIAECLAVLRPTVKGKFPHEQALEELVGYIAAPQPAPVQQCPHRNTVSDGNPHNEFCQDCKTFINRTALAEQQQQEARIAQLEAELMRMQGRELKLQFALAQQQEPIGKVIASVQHLRSISVELLPEVTVPPVDSMIYTSPQPAPVHGFKLVPVKPTQKMLDAPPNAYPADALVTWEAMLAAAPQPAQQQEPIGKVIASVRHLRSISVELLPEVDVPSVDSMVYTSPPAQRKPMHIGEETAAFKAWFDAWWIGDGEQGETIPTQSDKHFLTYLDQYTLGFGAWMAAKYATHDIKEQP